MSGELEVRWDEVPAERVLRYFVDGYDKKPTTFEWFYDPHRAVFVLKLYVPKEEPR